MKFYIITSAVVMGMSLFGQPAQHQPHSWSELLDLVHPDERELVDQTLGTAMPKVTREVEFRVVDVDGGLLWLAGRARTSAIAASWPVGTPAYLHPC